MIEKKNNCLIPISTYPFNIITEEWLTKIIKFYQNLDEKRSEDLDKNSFLSILLNEIVNCERSTPVKFDKIISEAIKLCYEIQVIK